MELICTPKSSTENPSFPVNKHGGSTNRELSSKKMLLKMNLDKGPQTKQLENMVKMMMKDRVCGPGTTTRMLGSLDHLETEN